MNDDDLLGGLVFMLVVYASAIAGLAIGALI